MRTDYYKILNISHNATLEEIKNAYRKQAKKYHPDSPYCECNDDTKFKEISEAYSTLSDPAKRKIYDEQFTTKNFENDFNVKNNNLWNNEYYSYNDNDPFADIFDSIYSSINNLIDDISSVIFPEVYPMTAEVILTSFEAISGCKVRLDIPLKCSCPLCRESKFLLVQIPRNVEDGDMFEVPIKTHKGKQYIRLVVTVKK